MSNIIDSIQLSGSSYDVRDKSATTVVEITQSEYDNLPASAKTSNILYIITDGNDYYITSAQCQTQIDNSISGKQDTLSAGTGIDITDNVISCTGGGGGGVTTGEVQTMIDESISGKVDTTTYTAYTASTDTVLSGKQETLVSGTNIKTINNQSLLGSGNIDIQGGGTGGTAVEEMTQVEYDEASSAGTLDAETLYIITDAPEINANEYVSKAENTVSATTIFVDYEGNFSNQNVGENIVRSVTFNYTGDKSSATNQNAYFSIVDTNTWQWYSAYAYFNYTDGTYTKDDSNNILDVTYDSSIEDFRINVSDNYPNCNISNVQFYGGYIKVPGSTIASGQSANVIQTSIANIFSDIYTKNLNYITHCYFTTNNNNIILSYNNGRSSSMEGGRFYLEDLKAENRNGYNYLSSDINIPLGTSGWTEINLSESTCELSGTKVKGFTTFRISGDTTQVGNWNLTIAVGYNGNYNWDNIVWDYNENTFVRSAGWSPDVFSTATVNWDSNTGYLTISYPDTFILDGQERQTEFFWINSQNCQYGNIITKFEYYAEQIQPIKSYVQQLRSDVNTKISTSAVTTAVTSGSTDAEIPTAKAVYDAIPQGGGGKAVSGGTNISVTTGETADTINCTLPISADSKGIYTTSTYPFSSTASKTGNVVFGYYNRLDTFGSINQSNYNTFFGSNHYISINGNNMFIAGDSNQNGYPASNNLSNIVLFGYNNKSSNPYETAFGTYNVSQYSSNTLGDSGNTLFSVGNGTSNSARHNAFEIRQNGDIYLSSGGTDIKLQDHLGGGSSYTAGDGIDITNNVISVTGMVATSSIVTAVTSSSTDSEVPSAKCLYDTIGNIETLLSQI